MYRASTCSLKFPSQMELTYNKTFICRSMTHFQYRNDVLSFDFCANQSYDDKGSLTKFKQSAHRVICNLYPALFMLFTSTKVESPIMVLALKPQSTAHESPIKTTQYEVVRRWENTEKNISG